MSRWIALVVLACVAQGLNFNIVPLSVSDPYGGGGGKMMGGKMMGGKMMMGKGGGTGATGSSSPKTAPTPVTQEHDFTVQTKGFIAEIFQETTGSLPGSFLYPAAIKNLALKDLAVATNAMFSEDPSDGTQASGHYRLWAQMGLHVKCVGNSVSSMRMTDHQTDAGYEGPLKAGFEPLATSITQDGRFYFLARGWPHWAAAPAFDAVQYRKNTHIWYTVEGAITCNNGDATINIPDVSVVTTAFPSFRLWTSKSTGGQSVYSESKIIDRPQGDFSELWDLPTPPAPIHLAGGD